MRKFILLLLWTISTQAYAKHIIGGELTYECLGNGNYRFTMTMYRDCSCVDCATLENGIIVSTYLGSGAVPFLETTINMLPGYPQNVNPPTFDCFTPPPVCVETGVYQWEVNLPLSNQSYHVVYQRCCRNETISNIVNPGDVCASFYIEITPDAQALCNNSPTFDEFPPTIICVGLPLLFDHSATDVDGDQLVYTLCPPLEGGGIDGGPDNPGGDPSSCTGISPTPPCAPPFDPVTYVVPAFSFTFPLGGSPVVTINSTTGQITGTPNVQGQYVVGVCVSEYRNGELLSVLQRDFQFNVSICEDLIVAQVAADSVSQLRDYFVRSCGDLSIDFINQSFDQSNIIDHQWQFFLAPGDTAFVETWDASVTFPDTGSYYGRLIIVSGTGDACTDTADIFIQIFPEIVADFTYAYDTCIAGPVTFTDESYSLSAGGVLSWLWDFDDGGVSEDENPVHLFDFPGLHDVKLRVTDENGCTIDTVQPILWYPAPPYLVVEPSTFKGCIPGTVFFNNLSFPIDSTYTIVWDFGDGTFGYDISPTHIYTEPGDFSVAVSITSPIGCFVEDDWPSWIHMDPSPSAGFDYTPFELTGFNKTVTFVDQSEGAKAWFWNFNDGQISLEPSPVHAFLDTGIYRVVQIVTNEFGCRDTAYALLDVVPKVNYFLPNAFSPNSDTNNDWFGGVGYFEGMKDFNFQIWNRWGELQYETDDPTKGWDGKKQSNGEDCELGVYIYVVKYTEPRGANIKLTGYATLVR